MESLKRTISWLIIFFVYSVGTYAQTDDLFVRQQIEQFFIADPENVDVSNIDQLLEELYQKQLHPFNLNTCNYDQLSGLYFLSPLQISNLLNYRKKYGRILSPYEVAYIPGFTKEIAHLLSLFVLFQDEKSDPTKLFMNHEVIVRENRLLEKQEAYKNPASYEGSPDHLYLKYKFTSALFSGGLTADKDPGESFFSGANPEGFDFYGFHLKWSNTVRGYTVYAGDYLIRMGQGLIGWQGFGVGKAADAGQVARLNQGVSSYSSSDENNFLRGIAITLNFKKWKVNPFFSYKRIDGNIDSVDVFRVFTSFQTSGYHRTEGEIADKDAVGECIWGGSVTYCPADWKFDLNSLFFHYSLPLERSDADYNHYLFESNFWKNSSVSFQGRIKKAMIYGELATDWEQGYAGIIGLNYPISDWLNMAGQLRIVDEHYNAPLGQIMSESSSVNDETGFYIGGIWDVFTNWKIEFYSDFFRFNSIKYTTAAPGSGQEYQAKITQAFGSGWTWQNLIFYERKPVKVTDDDLSYNLTQERFRFKMTLSGEFNKKWSSRTYLEFVNYKHESSSNGYLAAQGLGYHSDSGIIGLWWRLAYFYTQDYDSRVYLYENDLLYQFSVPSFYGKGFRYYCCGKVKICEKLSMWMKLAQTYYLGVSSIGSGNSLIDGNKRTEFKMQLRLKF